MNIRQLNAERLCDIAVLTLVAVTILWKGGKTLESTWLLVGIAAGCWLLVAGNSFRKREPDHEGMSDTIWLLIMLFILLTGLSYLFSSTQNYGLDEVLRTGGLGLLLLWYVQRREENENGFERKLLSLLATVTLIACAVGLLVYIAQPVNRFVGTFFDWRFHTDYWPNAAAQFLLLTWPVVLLHNQKPATGNRKPPGSFLQFFAPGLVLGCLFLTFSRGALIAFIGQIVLLTLLLAKQRGAGKTLTIPFRAIASAVLIGFLVFVSVNEVRSTIHPVQPLAEKVTFTAPEGASSVIERISFWKHAVVLSVQKPLFGWGPYSFRFVQPRLQEAVLATSDHPHNVFLKLSSERGGIAALLFAVLLLFTLRAGIVLSLTGKRFDSFSDHGRLGYALLTTALAGIVAHNLIDYNLQFVGIALPFWLIMGILIQRERTSDQCGMNSALMGSDGIERGLPPSPYRLRGASKPAASSCSEVPEPKTAGLRHGSRLENQKPNIFQRFHRLLIPTCNQKATNTVREHFSNNAAKRDRQWNAACSFREFVTIKTRSGITILLAVALLILALREGISLITSSLGRHAEARGDNGRALHWYDRSRGEWFSRDLFLSQAHLLMGEENVGGAKEALHRYLRQNPEDARAWKLLGEAHTLDNDRTGAVAAYERAFMLGGWNDLGISRGYLETLLAESHTQPGTGGAATAITPLIEERVLAFADAIRRNSHFVALSPNPEEASRILIALTILSPDRADEYKAIGKAIEAKTEEERAKIKSRKPGWLW